MIRRALTIVVDVVVGAVLVVASLYPVLWLIAISLKPDESAYETPTDWFFLPDLSNYRAVLSDRTFVYALLNSLQLTFISTALCVLLGSLAAYALSRYRVRGAATTTFVFAITRLVPTFAIVIPTFYMYRELNLLDTMPGLILALVAFQVPLSVLIMYRIVNAIPISVDEAARLDGASPLRIFWQVIMPIARPGLAASAVVTFILIWNEFLFILVLAGNTVITVPMVIATYQTDKQILWGSIAAASTISLIPILLLVLLAQRHLLSGLGMGAVRE